MAVQLTAPAGVQAATVIETKAEPIVTVVCPLTVVLVTIVICSELSSKKS